MCMQAFSTGTVGNVLDANDGEPTELKSVSCRHASDHARGATGLRPFANSYRRFQPGSFAPVDLTWGYGHRGTAIRIPDMNGPAARVEHRVAGADANPYLLLAVILGGMLLGLDNELDPGEETTPSHMPEKYDGS